MPPPPCVKHREKQGCNSSSAGVLCLEHINALAASQCCRCTAHGTRPTARGRVAESVACCRRAVRLVGSHSSLEKITRTLQQQEGRKAKTRDVDLTQPRVSRTGRTGEHRGGMVRYLLYTSIASSRGNSSKSDYYVDSRTHAGLFFLFPRDSMRQACFFIENNGPACYVDLQ